MFYQSVLDEIVEYSKEIFENQLVGIYLHGSMAMGCFNPNKSDIDLILVIRNIISDNQKLQFIDHLVKVNKIAPCKGIELSVVQEKYCKEFIYPTPFELHFSNTHLEWFMDNPSDYIQKMKGTDKDLAAHFVIIKKYGIVLYGAEINNVFSEVPKKYYIDSILLDIKEAKEEILKQPVYVILNLCRVAAFLESGLIFSKKQGGEWALKNILVQYRALVSSALQNYMSEDKINMNIDIRQAQAFAVYMLQWIEDKKSENYPE